MSKYIVTYDMKANGLPTLFQYRIFTIPAKERKDWDYDNLEYYLGEYELQVSPNVWEAYASDTDVIDILKEMMQDKCYFVVDNNKAKRYSGTKQYIKCMIPLYVLSFFKKLFISTLVYDAQKLPIPQGESIGFEFDPENGMVSIVGLQLYRPENNPFYIYAKNAASSLSVEAIGLEQYTIGADSEKIRDFYDLRFVSGWKEVKNLEKEKSIEDMPGIYMLYDANQNQFYVGKAIRLKERILQHQKNVNGNDPMPDFTHYRYSVISGEYYEFLYLIENAAIHDCAWMFNMPKAKRYTPSLGEVLGKCEKSLDDVVMVNTHEHQTRKQ